jgi:hypothetical protein
MPSRYRDLVPYLYTYKGGTACACGTTSTEVTVPEGSNTALIHAEGAAVYWHINGTAAVGTTAPGYVAQDNSGIILSCDNLTGLFVNGAGTAAVAHVEFYEA